MSTWDFQHDAKEGLSHLKIFNMKEDQGLSHLQEEENKGNFKKTNPSFSKVFNLPFSFALDLVIWLSYIIDQPLILLRPSSPTRSNGGITLKEENHKGAKDHQED